MDPDTVIFLVFIHWINKIVQIFEYSKAGPLRKKTFFEARKKIANKRMTTKLEGGGGLGTLFFLTWTQILEKLFLII